MLTMIFMTSFYRIKRNNYHKGIKSGILNLILPLFISLVAGTLSCTKDPVKIGIGLLPDEDFVNVYSTDTVGVKAYTMFDEMSVSSDSTVMVAGEIYDKYFGTTHCDFVTQLRLMSEWQYPDYTIDSVYLEFLPSQVSGDTAAVHYIRLYETGTELMDGADYLSVQNPDTIHFLGEYPMPVLKADSTYYVKLDNAVGEYLFRDTTMFKPPTDFYQSYFKGLYFGIRSETNPVMISMNTINESFGIVVYYHDPDDISYAYYFWATERAVNYNRYLHDFSTADPEKMIRHINDFVTDTAVFQQSYNGVFTRLDLPSLEDFRGVENIAVNKARLYVPVLLDGDTYIEKNLPAIIFLRYRNSENKVYAIPDLLHSSSFMGGTYSTEKDCYIFNIASFVQQYIEGKIETPSVEMFYPASVTQNAIFKANSNNPTIRFDFAYTIYK
jgi:hypothetical protein